jgi:hypothetical protein
MYQARYMNGYVVVCYGYRFLLLSKNFFLLNFGNSVLFFVFDFIITRLLTKCHFQEQIFKLSLNTYSKEIQGPGGSMS